MLNRCHTTTLLQIFSEFKLYAYVIFKSMRVADDTFQRNSECEWVKVRLLEHQYHARQRVATTIYQTHHTRPTTHNPLNPISVPIGGQSSRFPTGDPVRPSRHCPPRHFMKGTVFASPQDALGTAATPLASVLLLRGSIRILERTSTQQACLPPLHGALSKVTHIER